MILLGNKNTITKQEIEKLSLDHQELHHIDISNRTDEEIVDDIKKELKDKSASFLVLNLEKKLSLKIKSYLEELDYDGIKILIFSEFAKKFLDREYIEFNESNMETYNAIHEDNSKKIGKRIFDFCFSIFALVILAPIMIVIAFMIKLKSPDGKILFTQQRLGLNGKFFRVLKFRTMVPNAEQKLQEMLDSDEKARVEYLEYRKLQNDPRIIPSIGNFLRKSSLDELPQFFNVLLGDMSVVGPRPYIENEFYSHDSKFLDVILSTKPGVTGLWQVSSRNDTTFNDRVIQDIEYITHQSFMEDIKIIFKTILVVVLRKGI
jgi:exopolysaccharide production protein ExoY